MQKQDFLTVMKHRVVIFDGGMGSMLIAAGLTQREVPEQWLITKPEKIGEIHEAYVDAGAEVVTTSTFGANRLKLQSSEAGRKLDPARLNAALEANERLLIKLGRYLGASVHPCCVKLRLHTQFERYHRHG